MREPVEELQDLAKAVRLRAITEGRPYEIVFDEKGFSGRLYTFYNDETEEPDEPGEPLLPSGAETSGTASTVENQDDPKTAEAGEADEQEPDEQNAAATPGEPTPATTARLPDLPPAYELASGMTCHLLFWGKTRWAEAGEPAPVESEPGRDRWVFQPSGLCNPLRVQFRKESAWIEVAFNPLTADTQEERHYFPE